MADEIIRITADDLLAYQLFIHARDGDLDAFNEHITEMLTRGAGLSEQLQFRDLITGTTPSRLKVVPAARRRGRPGGLPRQVLTARNKLDRDTVGDAILQRVLVQQHRDRAAVSSALGWAETYFRIRRVMARTLLREALGRAAGGLRGHGVELGRRYRWPVLRAWLDIAEGRAAEPDADALIALGDRKFASIK